MASLTSRKKGGQAGAETSTGRGTQLFKKEDQPIFGSKPELLLNFTRYLKSAKMKRYMDRARGASPEDRQAFLITHLEKRIEKELANFRGQTYRVLCVYPDIEEIDVVPLWNTILTRTDFELSITADSSDIPEALEKIGKSNYPRINVGVTIATASGGTWDDKSLSALSQLQVCEINAFPKFAPKTPPKDWEKSLQRATDHFDLGKCERIWGYTASLVASSKKGVASTKELDVGKDQLAQGFYAALKKMAGKIELQFQHHPPRRFQADWERRLLSSTASDSFKLLLNYLSVPEACDEKTLQDLHNKVMREDSSKIESYTAMYDIYQITLTDAKGDEKMASRRFIKLCEVVWNRSRAQVTRNLAVGKFVRQLKETEGVLPLPEKEYHVRCICKLPEENRIACWEEIHDEIIRHPEDKKSISERVERYAEGKKISFSSKAKSRSKQLSKSKILTRVKELKKDASQLFGGESEILNQLEQLLNLVTAEVDSSRAAVEPMVVKESTAEPEQHPKEPIVQEQAIAPDLPGKPESSMEANSTVFPHREIVADQTVPIGTKEALQEELQPSERLPMPTLLELQTILPEPNHLLALALEQAPPPTEQDWLPEPEFPQQEKDPSPSGEKADAPD